MPQLQAAPPALIEEIRSCTKCSLHEGRDHPVVGIGDGRSGLLVLGEAPGAEEDRTGVPFVGRSGRLLRLILLQELGLEEEELTISNVVRCRPPKNRTPTRTELATCWPFMERQLAFLQPRAILTVGNTPSRALLQTKE
ncbi:MAG: uracil-DNA glycosylase, partial [Actinomycetota bacterium]